MGLTRPRAYQIFDIDYKQSVRVVTISNVTLSGGAPSQVDGVSLSLNDRVLVTGQSTGSQNGLYYVTTVGTGSNGTWARSVDGNETGEIDAGMIVMVTEGLVYADTQWKLTTNDPIVIGSTALTFVLNVQANSISSGSSNVAVNANANVTISVAGTTNVLSVSSNQITVSANIIPTANVTYDLGSLTNQWRDIYVGPGSLYVNGSKVLEESAGTILVTADVDQGVTVKTTGTGVTTLQSSSAVNITATGTADITLTTAVGGQIEIDGNVTVNSSKTINSSDAGPITFGDGISLGNNDISNVGTLTATGNITTSGYLLGNGSQLTGVITSVANINSGTSNVTVVSSGGNVTVGVGGTSNISVFSTAGQNVTGYLTASGNVSGSNLTTTGQVVATGNITTSGYLFGNGSQLTGIQADTIGGNITILTRATGNVNFAVTAGYFSILTRASGNVSFAVAA